jgi:hypothetical protein
MKTKRNKKFVTNKRKKNKKLIRQSLKHKNKKFTRKIIQKGGVGVYDKIRLNVQYITQCINMDTSSQISYNPKKDDYDSKLSIIKFNSNPNSNCIDTLKYYNTAKLSFTQLKSYLDCYKIYLEKFGKEQTLTLWLLGYLFIFCYLNNNKTTRDSTIIERLFRSVNPFVLETFVTQIPEVNFFWNYFDKYITLGNVGIGDYFVRSQRRQIYDAIQPKYKDFITIKDPHQLVSIFSDYRPYCSPFKYIGNRSNNFFNDNIELYDTAALISKPDALLVHGNHLFIAHDFENFDTLFNNYQFIRKLSNIQLLTDTAFNDNTINTKWDLIFDIDFNDDNYLDVIRLMYNNDLSEDLSENLSSFFRDAFLRTQEELYIKQNGTIYPTIVPDKDNFSSIYDFLLLLSGLIKNKSYKFELFKNEFDKNKAILDGDIVRQILISTGFPEANVNLCLRNLYIYIKMYFLSKKQYTGSCLSIKKKININIMGSEPYDVYGVFHPYSNGNLLQNDVMGIDNQVEFISNYKDSIITIINNFVRTSTANKINNYAKDKGNNTVFCANLFYDIIGSEYSEHKSYGVNLQQLFSTGTNGRKFIAYIIQVSICSIDSDGGVQSFELKYLLIWNNKEDNNPVYDLIYTFRGLPLNFREYFLKPILRPLQVQNAGPVLGENAGPVLGENAGPVQGPVQGAVQGPVQGAVQGPVQRENAGQVQGQEENKNFDWQQHEDLDDDPEVGGKKRKKTKKYKK